MVAVGRVVDIKTFGIDSFLEPFVKDLNKLVTDGITVPLETGTVTFRGTLLAFLADNLASHEVGGFKECHLLYDSAARVWPPRMRVKNIF